ASPRCSSLRPARSPASALSLRGDNAAGYEGRVKPSTTSAGLKFRVELAQHFGDYLRVVGESQVVAAHRHRAVALAGPPTGRSRGDDPVPRAPQGDRWDRRLGREVAFDR